MRHCGTSAINVLLPDARWKPVPCPLAAGDLRFLDERRPALVVEPVEDARSEQSFAGKIRQPFADSLARGASWSNIGFQAS